MANVHQLVYSEDIKKKDLCKKLGILGWWKYDEGTNHEKWTNGSQLTTVPRHREINELTAKGILKLAKANPGEK
ncbi:MAG: type II toxin-antitoxin system HicA family toxin [Planctomycetota bacterium]|jgi:mRNA interferase HicA